MVPVRRAPSQQGAFMPTERCFGPVLGAARCSTLGRRQRGRQWRPSIDNMMRPETMAWDASGRRTVWHEEGTKPSSKGLHRAVNDRNDV
jgi:hypothetical protein